MALEESGEQLSLQENQFICTQLDYPAIVSHLIQAGIITQVQNAQIQEAFVDNAGRMQELISILIKLNTETSFDAFREAVKQLGETILALKLLRDQSSLGIPRNAGDAHPCLFTVDVLSQILSYLTQHDLSTARLVCKTWNAVIAACHIKKFTARFHNNSCHKQMVEFVSTGSKSAFCKQLNRFAFDIENMESNVWVFYKTFFVKFGSKIQYLKFAASLSKDLLAFIFSPEIKECLTNLKNLELFALPDEELIQTDSLIFLSGLETLALTENSENSLVKGLHFLEKFSEVGHKLKVLRLEFRSVVDTRIDRFPNGNALLPKLSTLEDLILKGVTDLDDNGLRLLTIPTVAMRNGETYASKTTTGEGRLKVINFKIDNVSPDVFRDFITSHRHALRWIKISLYLHDNPLVLMEVFPRLENLKFLSLYAGSHHGGFGDSISNLKFCIQAPNLEGLTMHRIGSQIIPQSVPQPTFVHECLKELRLHFYFNSTADQIRGFLSLVPQYFPNLMELEAHKFNVIWPVQLEHLQLHAGSCSKFMGVWKSTQLD